MRVLVIIEGDVFLTTAIACILVEDDLMKVVLQYQEQSFEYQFDTEDEARAAQNKAVAAWKEALTVLAQHGS